MQDQLDIGAIVQLRKKHPCGSDTWVITRVGVDIGIQCLGCKRRVMIPRSTFVKRIKKIINKTEEANEEDNHQ